MEAIALGLEFNPKITWLELRLNETSVTSHAVQPIIHEINTALKNLEVLHLSFWQTPCMEEGGEVLLDLTNALKNKKFLKEI